VNVKIAFYENAFHGISHMIQFKVAKEMLNDLIVHLKQNLK